MSETEKDRMRTMGVLPGYDMDALKAYSRMPDAAMQVVEIGSVNNSTSDFYTVGGGLTLYLTAFDWTFANESGGAALANFNIRTSGGAAWYRVCNLIALDDVSYHNHGQFNPPLVIPAGYIFRIVSGATPAWMYASVHGFTM